MFLYHYYDASMKPFQNLSDVSIEEAKEILENIALEKPNTQCAKRTDEYMVVEHSPWLASWFENSAFIKNDGKYGPERYIEAHIWSDDVIKRYI